MHNACTRGLLLLNDLCVCVCGCSGIIKNDKNFIEIMRFVTSRRAQLEFNEMNCGIVPLHCSPLEKTLGKWLLINQ